MFIKLAIDFIDDYSNGARDQTDTSHVGRLETASSYSTVGYAGIIEDLGQ